jgi:aldehyde:ferredoxin oxidoreductase
MMIDREGIGDLLADGSAMAGIHLGKGSGQYAVHAGGQELAMHDGRNDPGFSLHAVVEPTPGRHTLGAYLYYEMFQLWRRVKSLPPVRSLFYSKKTKYTAEAVKGVWGAACSKYMSLLNGAGVCLFAAFIGAHRFPIFEWLNAVTGWQKTPEEYMQAGLNIQAVRQAFNAREGVPLTHSIHPRALGRPPQTTGANRGFEIPIEPLTAAYYRALGFDEKTGCPPEALLESLEIK